MCDCQYSCNCFLRYYTYVAEFYPSTSKERIITFLLNRSKIPTNLTLDIKLVGKVNSKNGSS